MSGQPWKLGYLLLTYSALWTWPVACYGESKEQIKSQIADAKNENNSDPRRLTQYDAYPVSAWPPLPTPNDKPFDVPVFGSGPRPPPLVVYSQPGVQLPPDGLQLRPHYPSDGDAGKSDYSQPGVNNAPPYGPAAPYQPVYPVPNYPVLPPSTPEIPTLPPSWSSTPSKPPIEASSVSSNAPFLVFTFSSTARQEPRTSISPTVPKLRVFTPAPTSPKPTTIKQTTPKQYIRVLTTPFGLAWRRAGFFINQFGTTPAPETSPPVTTSTASPSTPTAGTSEATSETTEQETFQTESLFVFTRTSRSPLPTERTVTTERPLYTTVITNGTTSQSSAATSEITTTESGSSSTASTVSEPPIRIFTVTSAFTASTATTSKTEADTSTVSLVPSSSASPTAIATSTTTIPSLWPTSTEAPTPPFSTTPGSAFPTSTTDDQESTSSHFQSTITETTDTAPVSSLSPVSDGTITPTSPSIDAQTPTPFEGKRIIPNVSKKPSVFLLNKGPQSPAPNRIRGKPHILCMANGIMFIAESFFPFDGLIFAKGRENRTNCSYDSNKNIAEIRDRSINVSFPYADCGEPIIAKKGDHMFQTDVVVSFRDGRVQTFLARCVSQKLRYDVDELPRKIEEALEELNLTPIKVESQAPMPMCTMRVVQEIEQQKHRYGPSNGSAINDAVIGQQLRMEFALNPPSAAFGFLIRNCTVLDSTIDARYVIIDDKGCSVDINIFAHPHYDTYHDLAIVHWHAFKVPDSAALSFRCDCVVCTEVVDDETGQTSCEQIPTPPICPDVVTSSTLQNALIFDSSLNQVKKKKRRQATEQNVRTGFCLSAGQGPTNCSIDSIEDALSDDELAADESANPMCLSKWIFAMSLGFNTSLLITSISVFCICLHRRHVDEPRTRRTNPNETKHKASIGCNSHGGRSEPYPQPSPVVDTSRSKSSIDP